MLSEESTEQEIEITPPVPHSKKQKLIMSAFELPGIREIWVPCGTKFGKTVSASVAQINQGIVRPDTKWRWVAPIYEQAKIAMDDYFPRILPPEPHRKPNLSHLNYKIPAINTVFEFWHASNPGSLEGAAVNGYVFDEAAKMKASVMASARTTTTRTKGPMMFISYPNGKNWFYNGCMEAKEHMQWAFKHGKQPEKIFIHAKTSDNPFIDPEVIENAKKELPWRLFRQFYLADFVDDGQVFVGHKDCLYGPEIDDLILERQKWTIPNPAERTVVISSDWAKTTDWTVFFAGDINTREVVAFERFHRISYVDQIRKLILFCRQFKSTIVVRHDKTGVGSAIDDQLAHTGLPYEGVLFTNSSKADMVAKLMTSFERPGQLWLPRWQTLIDELDAYDVVTSPSGLPTYSAPSGKHDDTVSSLMLLNQALIEYGDRSYEVKFLEDLPKAESSSPLQQFYDDLADDD